MQAKKKGIRGMLSDDANTRIISIDVVRIFLGVLVINLIVYGLMWNLGLKPLIDSSAKAIRLFVTVPVSLELICLILNVIWWMVGERTLNTTFPDSYLYIFVGSLIYALEYGIMVYYMGTFPASIFYMLFPIIGATIYRSWKWLATTATLVGIELVLMQVFPDKIERLMIKNIPTWVNVWFSLHMILLASALSLAVYFLRSNADKRVWEYEARSKARREFIFNMSHEIRTPVTTIMGMDELILREAENEQINEYAANIQSSCKSLLGFLNDILDYSKIESDDMELCLSKYSVGRLITDCYNSVVQLADAKGIKLALAIDSTIPKELVGDESRIRQIIMNLLSNAVKFTKEGTVIFRVSANPLDSRTLELVTSIEDSGVGIAEEDRERLFKAFAKTGNDKNGGTGLGLTIVDHLTRIMGGSISVNSKVNRGSIFTVILPQEIVSKEPLGDIYKYIDENTNIKKGYEAKFEAPNASVLVVDDVKINLMVITSLLKSTKVAISTAKNGKEAIEMCKKKHFDLILMDHLMPNLDGIETLSIIRESVMDGQNSDTPAIALTANVGYGNREDYIKAGFTDYLPKPVSGADLEEKLLKYLPKKLISKRSV